MTLLLVVMYSVFATLVIVFLCLRLNDTNRELAAQKRLREWADAEAVRQFKARTNLQLKLSEAYAVIESRAKLIEQRDETIRMHELVLETKTERLNDLISQISARQSKLLDVQAERDRYRAQVEKLEAAAQKPKTSKRPKS